MAKTKKTTSRKATQKQSKEVSFSLEPGARVQFTVEAGKSKAGKMPVVLHMEEVGPERERRVTVKKQKPRRNPFAPLFARLKTVYEAVQERVKVYNLATWLFIGAIVIYLFTRLVGLTHFPIYFFTDEALQTQFMADLARDHFVGADNVFLPPAFHNGDYFTLGGAAYMQLLPYLIFGKLPAVTRGTSAILTLIAVISVGIILRDHLKTKYWWAGPMFLSITPAWFIHSRMAFETAEFVAFYTGALCAYLIYRSGSPRYLYLCIFLSGLAFYTYSPAQVLVPVTTIALFISDWRYHWENRKTALGGLILIALLSIQYFRFRALDPDNAAAHLHTLGSFVFQQDISIWQKLKDYFTEYFTGIGTWYWYIPNDRDLQRHLMKGYGHIMIATLPFAVIGLSVVLRRLREFAYRTVLIAMLAAPVAASFVQVVITRTMSFVVVAAILSALGLEQVLIWLENPAKRLAEIAKGKGWVSGKIVIGILIFLAGCMVAYIAKWDSDRVAVLFLALLLALPVSGAAQWWAKRMKQRRVDKKIQGWNLSRTVLSLLVFAILATTNIYMFVDALKNGPTWYTDYGLGGMQYGAFQIFDIIKQYLKERPETKIIFSPSWANGTDVVARYFLNDPLPVQLASIQGYITDKLPLDDNTLFIMLGPEYDLALDSKKFKDVHVERTVPYPDGTPGFYFVRLRYADNADAMFNAEKAFRSELQESTVKIDGQDVKIRHSYLDAPQDLQAVAIEKVFDNDPYTPAKTFEIDPFVIELTFPTPRDISGFSIWVGSTHVMITMKCYTSPDAEPVVYNFEGQGLAEQPKLSFDFPQSVSTKVLHMEVHDVNAGTPPFDHIWELTFK